MGTPTNTTEKANQAAIVASTGVKVETANILAFHRFVAMVADQPCEHGSRNGHITPEAAARCGTAQAETELAELDNLPVEVDMDAKLAAVAITVVTVDRYKGLKSDGTECGCAFGHRDQATAQACVGATKRASAKALRASIPVQVAGSLATAPGPQATKPADQAPKASKLRSGANGNTGRA